MATIPVQSDALVPLSPTPAELLRIAVSQDADIDQLTKLMDLQERWERREAKKAYDQAMNQFKADPPRISKNHRVSFQPRESARNQGPVDYKHATLDHVCDQVIGALSKVGISHRWKVSQTNEWITVTCILTHELGHAEETALMGCPDNSGNKNSIQAVGSTVTYLQRYTLLAATGLATSDQDDDGRRAKSEGNSQESEGISDVDVQRLCTWISKAVDINDLRVRYLRAGEEAKRANDRAALKAFIRAKDERKRELR